VVEALVVPAVPVPVAGAQAVVAQVEVSAADVAGNDTDTQAECIQMHSACVSVYNLVLVDKMYVGLAVMPSLYYILTPNFLVKMHFVLYKRYKIHLGYFSMSIIENIVLVRLSFFDDFLK
jgi:hypothetical protein